MESRIEKIKNHVKENKEVYISVGVSVLFAGITVLIVKRNSDCGIGSVIHGTAKGSPAVPGETSVNALEVNRGGLVLGDSYALNNVSFIFRNRQGPPSWVVRCMETNGIFTSQNSAAIAMDIQPSILSRHLNGLLEDANGYHFERVCLAA